MLKLIGLYISFSFLIFGVATDGKMPDQSAASDEVIAKVDGARLTLSDLQEKRADLLFQARNAYYEAERKALDDLIDDDLLKKEARRESLTVDQLVDRHTKSMIGADPSDEALRVYYEGLDTNEPYEAVKDKILEHIRDHRKEKARAAYVKSLRRQAAVTIALAPPRMDIDLKNTPIWGEEHAKVTVVEFADYECPYCQKVHPELKRLQAEYRGRVSFAYKDTPLPMHSHAEKAAEAAHCAGVQGKYWEYHDVLFTTKQLDSTDLKEDARKLNLDGAAFDSCLDSGAQAEIVKEQLLEAQKLGLSGTPTFFVNGRFLSGAVTYDALREVVDQEIASASAGKQKGGR